MKTLKTLLSVSIFIMMFLYVQFEENKLKKKKKSNKEFASKLDSISHTKNTQTHPMNIFSGEYLIK